jgi:opacity protein-like surface antigen
MRLSIVRILLCGVGFLPLAGANAVDMLALPIKSPAPQFTPPSRQLECYAGVLAEVVISHPEFANVPVAGAYTEDFAPGGRGGGVVGCDFMFKSGAFLGADLTAAYGQVKGTNFGFVHNVPFESAVRMRLGYMLDQQFSVYVAGGASLGYLSAKDAFGVGTNYIIAGGQIATGIENRFTPDWRLRTEYAYTWPGSDLVDITGYPLARLNPTSHSVRMAIIRRF